MKKMIWNQVWQNMLEEIENWQTVNKNHAFVVGASP